jgi:hypothetical protein
MTPTLFHHIDCCHGMLRKRQWLAVAFASVLSPVLGQDYTSGLSSEMAHTSDVALLDSEMFVRRRDTQREVTLFLGAAEINLDYRPPASSLIGLDKDLTASKENGLITWREGLDSPLQWNFSAGLYQGFTDYRSLWLDEYYRQLFSGMPGYQEADVGGCNVGIGGRYEYLKATGLLNWNVGWQQDNVAPAYEKIIFGPLIRGTSELETWRFGLGSEHVLTPCLRFKQDAAAINTTDRAWRYTYAAETAWSVADNWTLRLRGEGTKEADFHSVLGALLIERDWEALWFAGIALRVYHDNGQIIDPLLISGAAPALDSYQLQLTLRYSGVHATWRLAIGPYLTRYAQTTANNAQFAPLYQDRDWLAVQAAWNWRF